jgi:cytoskeleton protein RodZ
MPEIGVRFSGLGGGGPPTPPGPLPVQPMPEIGATLREARMRERIDVSEIEAQTKIRAKYLRALENEEWDLLPGPTFVKSFLRTYGNALGLDGRVLVEEYKLHYEHPGDGIEPIQQAAVSPTGRSRARAGGAGAMRRGTRPGAPPRSGPSRTYMAATGAVGIVIVLLVYALLSGGSSPSGKTPPTTPAVSAHGTHPKRTHRTQPPAGTASTTATLASLKLEPSGRVYVCLIGDGGRKRIPGEILTPETPEPVYHARRFELTLGNNEVTLIVNGKPVTVPASSGAIGYAITRTGMRSLVESEEPTCK